MTSSDAPMTRVTRNFRDFCRAYFGKHRRSFALAGVETA
jgi:hypothetical protein